MENWFDVPWRTHSGVWLQTQTQLIPPSSILGMLVCTCSTHSSTAATAVALVYARNGNACIVRPPFWLLVSALLNADDPGERAHPWRGPGAGRETVTEGEGGRGEENREGLRLSCDVKAGLVSAEHDFSKYSSKPTSVFGLFRLSIRFPLWVVENRSFSTKQWNHFITYSDERWLVSTNSPGGGGGGYSN